ncbi:trypsin-like peptidase domain-containing protein [Rhodopila sp.]|jgi:serine protease Do|uniref:trypsin-like peptidase domain-containing protein n=1 Tax=Rhodopila sp. TaxID=2480087 RepID=UPI002C45FB0D|nr:trypsin-like peptidase domain-containing protein [Rhodopila sp.]HVZ08807.1 trypsin-like peptidase domain-containing protein [Rhodopila sp.]
MPAVPFLSSAATALSRRGVWRGLVLSVVLTTAACSGANNATARAAPDSFAPLVKKILPAVVNIAVTETVTGSEIASDLPPELRDTPLGREFRRRFNNRRQQVAGAGSGFIVDPTGIIVTNNHVVGHADKIIVSLADGRQLPAKVLGHDELTDVAVIKVDSPGTLPAVSWGDSRKVEVGDWILAAGNPFGLGGSVSVGIISARGRDLGAGPFDNFLQLDAPINPGNSGGPVFNMEGQVIGVSSVIVSPTGASVGIGFAIPSDTVSHIVAQLLDQGSIARGWLGVSVEDRENAVIIAALDRNGPAAKAGIRAGDQVVAVNGDPIDSSRGLIRAVAAERPGSAIRVTIRRSGREMDIPVSVGRRPAEQAG